MQRAQPVLAREARHAVFTASLSGLEEVQEHSRRTVDNLDSPRTRPGSDVVLIRCGGPASDAVMAKGRAPDPQTVALGPATGSPGRKPSPA